MKKFGFKVGVGLAIGIAALLSAAPQAKADPPCTKDSCPNEAGTLNNTICTNNPPSSDPSGSFRQWKVNVTQDESSCKDCDGDCTKHKVTYEVTYSTCELWVIGPDNEAVHATQGDYNGYWKVYKTTGGVCSN